MATDANPMQHVSILAKRTIRLGTYP